MKMPLFTSVILVGHVVIGSSLNFAACHDQNYQQKAVGDLTPAASFSENKTDCNIKTKRNPHILMNFDYRQATPECFLKEAEKIVQDIRDIHDAVAMVKTDEVTFDNVLKPLLDVGSDTRATFLTFAANVAVDKDIRDASLKVTKMFGKLNIEMGLRKDVFANIVSLSKKRRI